MMEELTEMKVQIVSDGNVNRTHEAWRRSRRLMLCSCRGEVCRKRRAEALVWRRALLALLVASLAATVLLVLNLL